ncbi:MAG TPA: H-X9-DG-CTERM domain-containing protein, partial [Verrucomicrobiae bacterium]
IAILAAMLLPALARAKAKAQQTVCLSNLKQWGLADSMYVSDYNERFPFPRYQADAAPADADNPTWIDIAAYHYNTKPVVGDDVWFNALPSYISGRPMYDWALSQNKAIFNATSSRNIFTCPTTTAQGIDALDQGTQHGFMEIGQRPLFSYGMNSKATANESIGLASSIPCKTTMVIHPSAFVLFADTRYRSLEAPYYAGAADQYPNGNSVDLGTPQNYTTRFSSRHNQGGQITFSDGHAAFYKYNYVVSDGTAVAPNGQTVVAGHDPGRADINWDCQGNPVTN